MQNSRIAEFMESENIMTNTYDERWNLSFTYIASKDILFVRSGIGCWKIIWNEVLGGFILYHMDHINKNMKTVTFCELLYGHYHRQTEVTPGDNMKTLLFYIDKHDEVFATMTREFKRSRDRMKKTRNNHTRAKSRSRKVCLSYVRDCQRQLEREADVLMRNSNYLFCY